MIVVMVTGVGSNIGQGIVKAIRISKLKDVRIIGTDKEPLSAGLFRCDKGYVLPTVDSDEYLERIIEICRKESVDIIFIGSDPEVPFFSEKQTVIENETGSKVLVANPFIVRTFHDKWQTAQFLNKNDLKVPRGSLVNGNSIGKFKNEVGFPLVIKPRIGAGSRNVFVVRDDREYEYALTFVSDPIIQEYIQGEEFTSGVFFDKNSNFKGVITMKRELSFGTTYRAIVDDFPEISNEIRKFASVLLKYGAVGPINIQTRYTSGSVYIIEINPRFSGTTVFRANFNFNEAEAAIRHFLLGEEIDDLRPSTGVVMRYWEEVYTSLEEAEEIKRHGCIASSASKIFRVF